MAKRITTNNPNMYAEASPSMRDRFGNAVWLVYGGDKFCQIANTKDNKGAARKKLNRIKQKTNIVMPSAAVKADDFLDKTNMSTLDCMVPNLVAKKAKTLDTNGNNVWSIFYQGVVIATISGTKDNRDAARRRLTHLEIRDDAELIQMGTVFKSNVQAPAVKKTKIEPNLGKNSFVSVILRYEGSDDTTDVKFSMGEFVHSDNAVKRFNAMESVLRGFEAALGSK